MLKKLIAPFQEVLLKRGLCVGCTYPLSKANIQNQMKDGRVMVQCKCKRRYIFNPETHLFKRMTFQEEKDYLNEI